MSIEATAEALAPETAMPVEVATPEISQDEELAAIFDRNETEDAPQEVPKAAQDAPEAAKEEEPPAEAPKPAVEAPSDLPKGVREHWADMPEAARQAVQDSLRESGRKLGEQGRLIQGINPIKDALVEATQKFGTLKDMPPAKVAQEVFRLAEISQNFNEKPLETMMGLIKQHGLEQQLSQALSGQQVTAQNTSELQRTIRNLESRIEQLSNPDFLREQVTAVTSQQTAQSEVQKFASEAEHWDKVEDRLPGYVSLVKDELGPDASPSDVLKAAYDLAVSRIVPEETKAPVETVEEAVEAVDPEKAKAALKAKSVNVTGKPSKPRVLSEDEELAAAWDRSQKR